MIRILFGKSIFCLVVCLSILCANPAAHAQITVSANPMTVNMGQPTTISIYLSGVLPSVPATVWCNAENSAGNTEIYYSYTTYPSGTINTQFNWTPANPGTYEVVCEFSGWHNYVQGTILGSVSVTAGNPSVQGFINPKYVVVGVIYAPPGSNSYAQYTNLTSVGNTITLANSFQSDVGYSVSTSGMLGAASFVGGGIKLTATESTDYTYGTSSSTAETITQTSTVSYRVNGTPTESPVNNDYDYILLWINPELLVLYTPPAGSNPASLVWAGYAFDPNDPASGEPPQSGPYISGPDIVEVQVGCLNGDFSCPSTLTWLNGVEGTGSYVTSGILARSWASVANGYQWPSGETPGLTFSDVCQILTFDRLSASPSQCTTQNDYTLLGSFPSTTLDGRYTKAPYPPNPTQYPVGGTTEQYSLVQTNTQSVSSGNSTQIKQAFSVEEEFGGSFFDLLSSTTTVKDSLTLTWNYSTLSTLTTTNTLTNALSITGPPDTPTYDGPVEFIAYQDNTFGTFVFVPVN